MIEHYDSRAAARDILQMIRETYVPSHDYQTVDLRHFPHVDRTFYEKIRASLETKGFIYLEDSEDLSLAKVKGNVFKRIPIRSMISSDGVIMAGIYHPRISALWLRVLLFILRKRAGKIVDFESEFSDGSFVCTSNAALAAAMKVPPMIHSELHPIHTSSSALLERHQERVLKHIKTYAVTPVRIRTVSEVRESQNRMNALKAAFRGELGEVSMQELKKISFSDAQAREIHEEVQKIRRQEPQS